MKPELAKNKRLNLKQQSILNTLYRFRFGTTELLANALNVKTKNKMNERLKVLLDQEYIGRHYEPEYRLLRKHATYFLLPKGIRALRQYNDKTDNSVLHNTYKDKVASEQFISHCLAIFNAYCELKEKYGEDLRFFTKSQLTKYEYFPQPLPDAYIRIQKKDEKIQYFLVMLQSERPFFVSVRKIKHHITYYESGEWDDTGTASPTILLICDNETLKKRIDKQLLKFEDDIDTEELRFLVRTHISDAF
jgi:Replication-relaxation